MSSRPDKRHSLERLLRIALGGLTLIALLLLTLAGILAVRDAANDFVTTRLEHDAEALVAMLDPQQRGFTRTVPPIYNQPYSGHYFAIRFSDGSLQRSRSLWDRNLPIEEIATGHSTVAITDGPQEQQLLVRTAAYRKQDQVFTIAIAEEIGAFQSTLRWMSWTAAVVVLLVVLSLILIQKRILRRAFRQLDLVREDVRDIGLGNKEALRTDVPSEIAPLVVDFNQLLTSWRGHLERSRHAAGNLAHALKTPLNLIMQEGRKSTESTISEQAERMHAMIDRELNRARLSGSAMAGKSFHPAQDIGDVVDTVQMLHHQKQLEIQTHIDAPGQLPYDQEDMLELIGNLLENAAKWAREKIRLDLRVNGQLRLVIEDDGPGIDSDIRDSIMNRGKRLDEATEGHGIGLAIVEEIVKIYNGTLGLGDSDEFGGLCVAVELPLPE